MACLSSTGTQISTSHKSEMFKLRKTLYFGNICVTDISFISYVYYISKQELLLKGNSTPGFYFQKLSRESKRLTLLAI